MSRSKTARLARNSTSWLLLLLCTALLAWRIDYRIEQYQPSSVGKPATVAFFDANERNIATLHEAHFKGRARFVVEKPDFLVDLNRTDALAIGVTERDQRRPETPPILPHPAVQSLSLFPNPPPVFLP